MTTAPLPTPVTRPVPSERSRKGLAGFMLGAGVMHFVAPTFYEQLIPKPLGNRRAWVLGSGVVEMACGALVWNRRTSRLGAWLSLLTLIGVYPGNLKMAADAGVPTDPRSWGAWIRLPLQVPMWVWAYRHTRGRGD
jgi:uncharacterized membrane protein